MRNYMRPARAGKPRAKVLYARKTRGPRPGRARPGRVQRHPREPRGARAARARARCAVGGGGVVEPLATGLRPLVLLPQGPGRAAALRHVPDAELARRLHAPRRHAGAGPRPHQRLRGEGRVPAHRRAPGGGGHEIDFTIADLAADARAPTPSGAAELVVPESRACLEVLARGAQRLTAGMQRELRVNGARLENTRRRLKLAHPGVRLQQQMQRLDELGQRLSGAAHTGLHRDQMRLAHSITALVRRSPDRLVREYRARHQGAGARLEHAAGECLSRAQHRLALAQRALNAVSPLATLTRGFAIVTRATGGTLLTDAAAVAPGEEIEARLARGSLSARVTARRQES